MPFKRFVETGRVAYIAEGPHQGKLCSIVDVINQTRALIDGPETGVPRGQIRLNQLHLTKFRIRFPFCGSTRVVRKAWKDGKVDEKWKESVWYQKVEAKKKACLLTGNYLLQDLKPSPICSLIVKHVKCPPTLPDKYSACDVIGLERPMEGTPQQSKGCRLRAELTDFDRYKLRYARRMRNKIRSRVFFKLRATKGGKPKGEKKAAPAKKAKTPKKPAEPKKK